MERPGLRRRRTVGAGPRPLPGAPIGAPTPVGPVPIVAVIAVIGARPPVIKGIVAIVIAGGGGAVDPRTCLPHVPRPDIAVVSGNPDVILLRCWSGSRLVNGHAVFICAGRLRARWLGVGWLPRGRFRRRCPVDIGVFRISCGRRLRLGLGQGPDGQWRRISIARWTSRLIGIGACKREPGERSREAGEEECVAPTHGGIVAPRWTRCLIHGRALAWGARPGGVPPVLALEQRRTDLAPTREPARYPCRRCEQGRAMLPNG